MHRWFHLKANVEYTQAYGCWLCLHVLEWALFIGSGVRGRGPRIEVCTPRYWFRFSRGYRDEKKTIA